MRKYISLRSYGSSVLQLARCLALYSCIYNLYCNHQVLAQLLHHFLPYISWIAPARQQCSTFWLVYWRAGASQPSRSTGTIFSLSVCRHTVMFYVILRQRNFTYKGSKVQRFIVHRVSRMRKYISLHICVVGLRYTAVLSFACCWLAYTTCTAIIKFLLNSSIIFCRTLVGSLPLANNVQHYASNHLVCHPERAVQVRTLNFEL